MEALDALAFAETSSASGPSTVGVGASLGGAGDGSGDRLHEGVLSMIPWGRRRRRAGSAANAHVVDFDRLERDDDDLTRKPECQG